MNNVTLTGRLTADPELRQTPANISVCSFFVAVDKPYKQGEERKADFIPVVAWRNTAEFISRNFSKGQRIEIVGKLSTSKFDDKDGKTQYRMDVVADSVEFGGSKASTSSNNSVGSNNSSQADDDDFAGFEEILGSDNIPF